MNNSAIAFIIAIYMHSDITIELALDTHRNIVSLRPWRMAGRHSVMVQSIVVDFHGDSPRQW